MNNLVFIIFYHLIIKLIGMITDNINDEKKAFYLICNLLDIKSIEDKKAVKFYCVSMKERKKNYPKSKTFSNLEQFKKLHNNLKILTDTKKINSLQDINKFYNELKIKAEKLEIEFYLSKSRTFEKTTFNVFKASAIEWNKRKYENETAQQKKDRLENIERKKENIFYIGTLDNRTMRNSNYDGAENIDVIIERYELT